MYLTFFLPTQGAGFRKLNFNELPNNYKTTLYRSDSFINSLEKIISDYFPDTPIIENTKKYWKLLRRLFKSPIILPDNEKHF